MHDPAATFGAFIAAFNALDFERFRQCLPPDVSLFAPRADGPQLIEGATAVETHFAAVFEAEAPAGPGIRPAQVRVTSLAADAALVTFEFPRSHDSTGRRTLVMRGGGHDWRIVHIHASNTSSV